MFCCCDIYFQFQYSFSTECFLINLLFPLLLSKIREHFSLQFVRWRRKHVFIVAVCGACLCLICLSYFSSNLLLRIGANDFCFNLPFNFWKSSKSHHHYQPSSQKWRIHFTALTVGELRLNWNCAVIAIWIVADSSHEDTAVVNSCGVRISQVGSGSLQDLWWVLYTPPSQFPSSRCKVWRGAKSRHSCQKTGFLLMLLWGKNPPPNARVRFSGNHFTWVIWSVMHPVKARLKSNNIVLLHHISPCNVLRILDAAAVQWEPKLTKPPNIGNQKKV